MITVMRDTPTVLLHGRKATTQKVGNQVVCGLHVYDKAKKKYMCVYGHMLKKIRVGRSEIIFF